MRHFLTQPHLRTQQLIKLIDASRRGISRSRPPTWLSDLLDQLCDHIEPVCGEARVGYNFRFVEPCWQIDLFLGKNELVGGSLDGLVDYVSYTANIAGILGLFSKIQRCEWLALLPTSTPNLGEKSSGLAIEGDWQGIPIRVILRMVPPTESGVGLKSFQDGSYAVV
jgi:hypothetical protein